MTFLSRHQLFYIASLLNTDNEEQSFVTRYKKAQTIFKQIYDTITFCPRMIKYPSALNHVGSTQPSDHSSTVHIIKPKSRESSFPSRPYLVRRSPAMEGKLVKCLLSYAVSPKFSSRVDSS